MKYSMELLQKPVISADRNEKMGRINGFVIDPDSRRLSAYLLEPAPDQKSFMVVPFSNTKSIYHDAVIVENIAAPLPLDKAPHIMELFVKDVALVGAQVITNTGQLAGEVKDFAFAVKTGDLTRLRIDPKPGFPESFDMVNAIKLARERIMVLGDIYDPNMAISKPPKPKPVAPARPMPETALPAPAKAQPAPPAAALPDTSQPEDPGASEPAPVKKSSVGPTVTAFEPIAVARPKPVSEPEPTPRVDAVRMQLMMEDLRKDLRGEIRDLAETVVKDNLRQSLQELSLMLMDRINALDPAERLDQLKKSVIEEIKDLIPKPEPAPDPERVLEEKLKQLVVSRLDASDARAANIQEQLAAAAGAQDKLAGDLLEKIGQALEPAGAEPAAEAAAPAAAQDLESLRESVAALSESVKAGLESARAQAVTREEMAGLLEDQQKKFQERTNALRQSFIEDVRELAVSIIEDRLRATGDRVAADMDAFRQEIAGVPAAVKDAVKQFQTRAAAFDARLDSAQGLAATMESLKSEVASKLDAAAQTVAGKAGESAELFAEKLDAAAQALAGKVDASLKNVSALVEQAVSGDRPESPALGNLESAVQDQAARLAELRNELNTQITLSFEKISQALDNDRDTAAGNAAALHTALNQLPDRLDALAAGIQRGAEMNEKLEVLSTAGAGLSQKLDAALDALSGLAQNRATASQLEALAHMPEQIGLVRDRLDQAVQSLESRLAAATETVESMAADAEARPEALAAHVRETLAPVLEAAARFGDNSQLQEFLEQAVDRFEEGLAALRFDFTGGPEGRGGIFMQQLERMDAAVANHTGKLAAQQADTRARIEKLGADVEGRFEGVRATLEDTMRREIASFDENAAGRSGELRESVKKLRETLGGLSESLGGDKLEAFRRELLDEIRMYSEAAVKSEDLIKAKEWLEQTVEGLLKSTVRESEEKMGRALVSLNRFQEEIATDAGQFRHDVQEMRDSIAAVLQEKLDSALEDLNWRLDLESLRESVHMRISETAKKSTEAARADVDHLQDLIRNVLLAIEEARDQDPGPAALLQNIEQAFSGQIQAAVDHLEQRVSGGAAVVAETLDARLTGRDAGIQKTLAKIEETLEKLLKRGPGMGLGDMFSGGLLNIFGNRSETGDDPARVDETRRIGDNAARPARPRKRPGPSGAVEAAQVRRLSYLLGKPVTRAIEDKDGTLIADQGDVVDEDMIRVARDSHMVLDLIRAVDLSRR